MLTDKQKRFVQEYLIDLNATQAAIRAGYSEKTARVIASQTLDRPEVQAAIAAGQQRISKKLDVTAERVIAELARIGFSNMRDFTEFGPAGVMLKDMTGMDEDMTRCIAEVSQTVSKEGGSIRFKLHDKKGALDSLARHLGLFNDKLEVTAAHEDFLELMAQRANASNKPVSH